MNRQVAGIAVLCLLWAGIEIQAQETYSLKLPRPNQGSTYDTKIVEGGKSVRKVTDGQGAVLENDTEILQRSYLYSTTIQELTADKSDLLAATKTYDKVVINRNGEIRLSSLEGKTVVQVKKGDKFHYHFDDGTELTKEQLADLDGDDQDERPRVADDELLPKQTIQVGETWTVDPAIYARMDPQGAKMVDFTRSKIGGKLLRASTKDGCQFGTIEIDWDLVFKEGHEQDGMRIESGRITGKSTFEGCIDGKVMIGTMKSTMNMELKGTIQVSALQMVVIMEISVTKEESCQEAKKK